MTIRKYWKIIREHPSFSRLSLTKIGYIDPSIDIVYTFKTDPSERYLAIELSAEPSKELMEQLNHRLSKQGELTACEDKAELLERCFNKEPYTRFLVHFDRKTYIRQE